MGVDKLLGMEPEEFGAEWSVLVRSVGPDEWRVTVRNSGSIASSFVPQGIKIWPGRDSVKALSFEAIGTTQLNPEESVDFRLILRLNNRKGQLVDTAGSTKLELSYLAADHSGIHVYPTKTLNFVI